MAAIDDLAAFRNGVWGVSYRGDPLVETDTMIAALALLLFIPELQDVVSQHLQRGYEKAQEKDYQGAITEYTKAIEADPQSATAYNYRGNAKAFTKDETGALADYDKAIALDSRYPSAYSNRGLLKSRKGDQDGAIADYTRCLELSPRDPTIWNLRALAKDIKKDQDGALADYQKALELDPRFPLAHCNCGVIRAAKGDYEGAIADFTKAIDLDPENIGNYLARGNARASKGDWKGSAEDHSKVLERAPQNMGGYLGRGLARVAIGEYDGAIADYSILIARDPKNGFVRRGRGLARAGKGDYKGSIEDLSRAIELEADGWTYFERGCVYSSEYLWSEALADFKKARELLPKTADYPEFRIWLVQMRMGKREQATKDWKSYLDQRMPSKDEDWYLTASRYYLGEIPESALLKAAEVKDLKNAKRRKMEAHFAIANVYLLREQVDQARTFFAKCLQEGDPIMFYYTWNSAAELTRLKH